MFQFQLLVRMFCFGLNSSNTPILMVVPKTLPTHRKGTLDLT